MGIERLKAASKAAGFAMANHYDVADQTVEPRPVFIPRKQERLAAPPAAASRWFPAVSGESLGWLNPFARRPTAA